jgi:hypothetical protein
VISAKNGTEATNRCPEIVPGYIQLQTTVVEVGPVKIEQQVNPKNIQQSRNLRENVSAKGQVDSIWQVGERFFQRFVEEAHIFIVFPKFY